jgi:hypothetical protein
MHPPALGGSCVPRSACPLCTGRVAVSHPKGTPSCCHTSFARWAIFASCGQPPGPCCAWGRRCCAPIVLLVQFWGGWASCMRRIVRCQRACTGRPGCVVTGATWGNTRRRAAFFGRDLMMQCPTLLQSTATSDAAIHAADKSVSLLCRCHCPWQHSCRCAEGWQASSHSCCPSNRHSGAALHVRLAAAHGPCWGGRCPIVPVH